MARPNPFSVPPKRTTKVLALGPTGSGKTVAGLSFPGVALLDTEGGANHYPDPPAGRIVAVTFADVMAVLDWVREDNGRSLQTLMIDSLSAIYHRLQTQYGNPARQPYLTMEDNKAIRAQWNQLIDTLAILPVNVFCTARATAAYKFQGSSPTRLAADKEDVQGDTRYFADVVVRMRVDQQGQRRVYLATVEKTRPGQLVVGQDVIDFSYTSVAPAQLKPALPVPLVVEADTAADFDESDDVVETDEIRNRYVERIKIRIAQASEAGVAIPKTPDFKTTPIDVLEAYGLHVREAIEAFHQHAGNLSTQPLVAVTAPTAGQPTRSQRMVR